MGTPAKTTGTVNFDSPAALSLVVKQIDDWIESANNGKFPKGSEYAGDYQIELVSWDEDSDKFEFEGFSDRCVNLVWQMEQFCNFCKALPGAKSFSADITVISDSVGWDREDN